VKLNTWADALIQLLAQAATAPNTTSPYLSAKDIKAALNLTSVTTVYQVVTRASLRVGASKYAGSAIFRSDRDGYRLADEGTKLEIIEERARLKATRTKTMRTAHALLASGSGPMSKMVGQQLLQVVNTVIDPAIASMPTIIAGAP
jgi:hypothetical protein